MGSLLNFIGGSSAAVVLFYCAAIAGDRVNDHATSVELMAFFVVAFLGGVAGMIFGRR